MSFSQDIRASGNYRRQFSKQKRRLQLSEIPKADIDSLQEHVNELRAQIHAADGVNTSAIVGSVPLGPHDYIFEPDYNEVKLRCNFNDMNGRGNYLFQTLNSVNYYSLELANEANPALSTLYYYIPETEVGTVSHINNFDEFWHWQANKRPTSMQSGNSIYLNEFGVTTKQFLGIPTVSTNFTFTTNNLSLGFWIYPTDLTNSGSDKFVAGRQIDSSNRWAIFIDDADTKLKIIMKVGGTETKRKYNTALTANNWYFICTTWQFGGPTLVLKANNQADTSHTDSTSYPSIDGLYFGSYPGATTAQDFNGFITGITYYKHSTVLTSGEMTSLYTYNTKSNTTKPGVYGMMEYG